MAGSVSFTLDAPDMGVVPPVLTGAPVPGGAPPTPGAVPAAVAPTGPAQMAAVLPLPPHLPYASDPGSYTELCGPDRPVPRLDMRYTGTR
jgi:hypothetical protein